MLVLLLLFVAVSLGTLNTIFGAWVCCRIAEWFLHKEVALSFAVGVLLLINYVRYRRSAEEDKEEEKKTDMVKAIGEVANGALRSFLFSALTLLCAFILHRILG